jgi:hypothetical protein
LRAASQLARVHPLKLDGRDSEKTNDGRLVCVLLHRIAKTTRATWDKQNSNDWVRLIEPQEDGCEQSRVPAFKATDE